MDRNNCELRRWAVVALYAVAMAWVEAAAVYYLRTLTDRIEPHQRNPLPIATGLGEVELVRELATLLMLFAVGWLAERPRAAGLAMRSSLSASGTFSTTFF